MNLLFYSALPAARYGGVVRWMQQMTAILRSMGHRVHVLTWGVSAPDAAAWGPDLHVHAPGAGLARLPLLRFWLPLLSAARAGRHLIEECDIQVVHCVAVYEAASAVLARGTGPAAVVLSVHGDYGREMALRWKSRWRRRINRPLERIAFRQCDAVTTSSCWLRARLADRIGGTQSAVVPNGIHVELEEGQAAGRQALGLPEGRPIVLTVNNLYAPYRREGLALLAEAAPAIVERVPDVLFVVAGGVNDPSRDRASLAWAHEITRGLPFHFTGYLPCSPAGLMAAADLYLHSSTLDNSPTAVLEAMALGRPIVATGVGGIPELISDGDTGLLVPLDSGALAAAAVRLLQDGALAQAMGQAARRRARSEFTWRRAGERFTELYEQVVQARSRGREAVS